jgi:hypothetical protein
MSEVICYGIDGEEKCYWQKRFWQLWSLVDLEQREAMSKLIGDEDK